MSNFVRNSESLALIRIGRIHRNAETTLATVHGITENLPGNILQEPGGIEPPVEV